MRARTYPPQQGERLVYSAEISMNIFVRSRLSLHARCMTQRTPQVTIPSWLRASGHFRNQGQDPMSTGGKSIKKRDPLRKASQGIVWPSSCDSDTRRKCLCAQTDQPSDDQMLRKIRLENLPLVKRIFCSILVFGAQPEPHDHTQDYSVAPDRLKTPRPVRPSGHTGQIGFCQF